MRGILDEVVVPFVAKFDCPFRYNEAIERLWAAKAFDAPEELAAYDLDELAAFVGAHYCAMIREDIYYYLPEAIQHAKRSRDAAGELEASLALDPSAPVHYRYVLVRWTDALGRIYYRTGNYALARVEFAKCLELMADRRQFYWCWPDIHSNLLRTVVEIASQAGDSNAKGAECYWELLETAVAGERDLAVETDEVRQIELKRGIVSAYHNTLHCGQHLQPVLVTNTHSGEQYQFENPKVIELPLPDAVNPIQIKWILRSDKQPLPKRLHQFEISDGKLLLDVQKLLGGRYELQIGELHSFNVDVRLDFNGTAKRIKKYIKGDVYREAQFINADAQTEMKLKRPEIAKRKFKLLQKSKWPRGRFIGNQNLAAINGARKVLLSLCKQIDVESRASGGLDVLDLERFNFTLSMAEKLVAGMSPAEKEELEVYQRSITQAVSSVISVATYRNQFERRIRGRVQQLIEDRTQKFLASARTHRSDAKNLSQQFDDLLDFLESFVAREVLEVLRNNRSQKFKTSSDPSTDASSARFLVHVTSQQPVIPAREKGTNSTFPDTAGPKTKAIAKSKTKRKLPVLPVADLSPQLSSALESSAETARLADELHWLDNPLRIREAPGSTSQRARQVTVSEPKTLVVRFAVAGSGDDKHILAFWWYRGKAYVTDLERGAFKLAQDFASPETQLKEKYYFSSDTNTRIPRVGNAQRLWKSFLAPILKDLMAKFGSTESLIESMTIVLESGLFHLPLNLAWVPPQLQKVFASEVTNVPLALACNLCFSLNMTSHFLEGRREYGNCLRFNDEDDLAVLQFSQEKDFDGPRRMQLLENVAHAWGPHATYDKEADAYIIEHCLRERAEFLMFACHGSALKSGPVLHLNGCQLVSYNLSYSVALSGNRLLILGACDSATPSADSYGQFIGAFVAAGAGAILANPCLAMIPTVCGVSASILNQVCHSPMNGTVSLPKALRLSAIELSQDYPYDEECDDTDRKLWASTFQLWL